VRIWRISVNRYVPKETFFSFSKSQMPYNAEVEKAKFHTWWNSFKKSTILWAEFNRRKFRRRWNSHKTALRAFGYHRMGNPVTDPKERVLLNEIMKSWVWVKICITNIAAPDEHVSKLINAVLSFDKQSKGFSTFHEAAEACKEVDQILDDMAAIDAKATEETAQAAVENIGDATDGISPPVPVQTWAAQAPGEALSDAVSGHGAAATGGGAGCISADTFMPLGW